MRKRVRGVLGKIFSRRGLFWSWNLIFLAFMFLGFGPQILPDMIREVQVDAFPVSFLVYAVVLTAIPALTVILGVTVLRDSPERLFALGYGLEGPLMLMLAIRFFAVREMTPPVAFLMFTAALGMVAYLWQLLDRKIDERGAWLAYLRVVGLTLLLFAGLYASLWIAFYAVPISVFFAQAAVDTLRNFPEYISDWWRYTEWGWIPFSVLGFTLMVYTATLFIGMPIAVSVLYSRAWWRSLRTLTTSYGWPRPLALTTALLLACLLLFVQSNQQAQHVAFAMLEEQPTTPAEAQALLDEEERIRAGLLNAYLSPFRYFSVVGEVDHISEMYGQAFNIAPERAKPVQALYERLARPVLYEPIREHERENRWQSVAQREESAEAAELYKTFFDQPINEGEKEAVVEAARSTWSIDQAQAAWQAVDDREIHLTHQELTISEQGEWAEIELYEVYENQTTQEQEVVYYFSLPESAVITGVWLGNSPNRDERFAYRVSPRGAAQAVYRNEVRRNFDPALVEQIGPRQYRLRVFPIEPLRRSRDNQSNREQVDEAPPLHMWLTWRVLASDNAWPMPHLAEKRNVYWNSFSERLVNGQAMEANDETWLPNAIPATSTVTPTNHRVDFPNGESVLVRPISESGLPSLDKLSQELHLAVVLDRSRSMKAHQEEVNATVAQLNQVLNSSKSGAQIDLYLTASPYRGEAPSRMAFSEFDPESIMYYGGQNAAELLAQFDSLQEGEEYDAILVLTDGSGYELGASEIEIPQPDAPIWMVHLGGDLPLGYDDDTLQAIQASGGGVSGDLTEALTRLAIAIAPASIGTGHATADVIDGYIWLTVPTEIADAQAEAIQISNAANDSFAPIAARRLILSEMYRQRGALDQVDTLDQLHAIAIEQSIVTPYSSMIVLVNKRQKDLLDDLEAQDDRFEREHEEVGETEGIAVTGVPEPEEWLLLALAAAMLIWYLQKTRRETRMA